MSSQGQAYAFTFILVLIVGPPLLCLYKGIEYISEKDDNGKIREASTSEKVIGGILITLGIILSIIISGSFINYIKDESFSLKFFIFCCTLLSVFFMYNGLNNNEKLQTKVQRIFAITVGVILILNILASSITLYFFTKDTSVSVKNKRNNKKYKNIKYQIF